MNEHRFWRGDYWTGRYDARPLALLRIGIGVLLLQDLAMWLPNLRAFLTDDGILPRELLTGPTFGVFSLVGSVPAVAAVFALGVAATLAFTLGWRTRVMSGLVYLFFVSLHHRNPSLGDGGDEIARMIVFWGLFTNLGGVWSLDARAGRGEATVPALGAHLIMMQIAIIYFGSGLWKVRGEWLHHNIIFQVMQVDGFVRPPGQLLLDLPRFCKLATLGTLAGELVAPILMHVPFKVDRARTIAIVMATSIQLGIMLTMRVGTFTGVMLWSSVVFFPSAWLDRIERRWPVMRPMNGRPAVSAPSTSRWYRVVCVLAALQFAASSIEAVYRVPSIVTREIEELGLEDGLNLFSGDLELQSWRMPGTLDDGSLIDILPIAAPELRPTDGYLFSRWTKLRFETPLFEPLARYMCREYAARAPRHRLVRLTIEKTVQKPKAPSEPAPEAHVVQLWSGRCP